MLIDFACLFNKLTRPRHARDWQKIYKNEEFRFEHIFNFSVKMRFHINDFYKKELLINTNSILFISNETKALNENELIKKRTSPLFFLIKLKRGLQHGVTTLVLLSALESHYHLFEMKCLMSILQL